MIITRQEIPSVVTPSRLFKAFIVDSHNVLPKIVPERIRSVEPIEGNGGVGSIKKTNFVSNSRICRSWYAKHKIDAIDEGSFYCKYTMIESDIMPHSIEKIQKEVKFVASRDGCVCKMIIDYHVPESHDVSRDYINWDKTRAKRLFNAVEEYLMANPSVCA